MKLRQHSVPLSILLLQLLSLVNVSSLDTATDLSVQLARRDADIPTHPSLDPTKIPPEAHIGKKDGPLDGKDGLPHEGPFVETSAQRERKKALESGDDDAPTAAKRPGPSDGSSTKDGWNKDMPVSNDGVMDDPNRVGPKEGTRGIEGGITEKTRGKFGLDSAKKMPEEPKEAPPLPHSEQEKLSVADDRELRTDKEGKDPKDADKDDISELGGLTVGFATELCYAHTDKFFRSLTICPKNPTTFLIPYQ